MSWADFEAIHAHCETLVVRSITSAIFHRRTGNQRQDALREWFTIAGSGDLIQCPYIFAHAGELDWKQQNKVSDALPLGLFCHACLPF